MNIFASFQTESSVQESHHKKQLLEKNASMEQELRKVKMELEEKQSEFIRLSAQLEQIDQLFQTEKERYEQAKRNHTAELEQCKVHITNLNSQIEQIQQGKVK